MEDRFGIDRPLVDDSATGPLGIDRPFVRNDVEILVAELESAVADERNADKEYQKIITQLRNNGFDEAASTVEQIRDQEMEHKNMLSNILSKVRRDTS